MKPLASPEEGPNVQEPQPRAAGLMMEETKSSRSKSRSKSKRRNQIGC
jgi:hypothetical protein